MTKGERISKLENRMTTAEELLADLRRREGGIAVTGDLAEAANRTSLGRVQYIEDSLASHKYAVEKLTQERDELRRHLGKVMSERDALRARIDAGVVVYERNDSSTWGSYRFDSKRTARLIDRQPIEQDERNGDRRRHKEETTRDEESGIRYWFDKSHHIRDEQRTNNRRRKDGTRADREVGK